MMDVIEGLEETLANMAELPKATQRNALRRVLREAGAPLLAGIKSAAPRNTGFLIEHLDMSATLTANERRVSGSGAQFVGVSSDGTAQFRSAGAKYFAEIHIGATGKTQSSPVAMWQEFGTDRMPAHPFMRPVWEAGKSRALDTISSSLGGAIEQASVRRARKLARLARG